MILRSKGKRKYPDFEKLRRLRNRILAGLIAVFFILGLGRDYTNRKEYETVESVKYSFHFPDLGQGDCTVIKSENECIVIDTGPYDSRFICGEYISNLSENIDMLIFTHPHSDHIGGFEELIERTVIRNVMIPDIEETNSQYSRYLSMIERAGINLVVAEAGRIYTVGEISLQVLAPLTRDDGEGTSIVVKAVTEDVSVLVTGDIDSSIEKALIEKYSEATMKADVLKVPHHGSAYSSCEEFLVAVSPTYAVICCDEYNSYGHPAWQTQDRLKLANIPYYTTSVYGNIVFVSDGKNVEIG